MARLLSLVVLAVLATELSAVQMFDAKMWVQSHSRGKDAPGTDDLTELQAENPEAYALVKALLVKNSLGLIKRKDSTSDADSSSDSGDDSGAAEPAPTHSTKNLFNWKPADDSAAVQSVLGSVAGSLSTIKSHAGKTSMAPDAEEGSSTAAASPQTELPTPETFTMPSRAAAPETPQAAPAAAVSSPLVKDLEAEESTSDGLLASAPASDMSNWPARSDEPPQKAASVSSSAPSSTSGTSDDDLFSKGAIEATVQEPKPAQRQPAAAANGGKSGAFWSGLFGGVAATAPKKSARLPAPKKKVSAIGEGSGYLKNFDWNSDDNSDGNKPAPSSSDASGNQFNLPAGNSYSKFLS